MSSSKMRGGHDLGLVASLCLGMIGANAVEAGDGYLIAQSDTDLTRPKRHFKVERPADLSGADLSNANLEGSALLGVNLSRAKLSDARLRGAQLLPIEILNPDGTKSGTVRAPDIRNADLRGADLADVQLSACNTEGARFD